MLIFQNEVKRLDIYFKYINIFYEYLTLQKNYKMNYIYIYADIYRYSSYFIFQSSKIF